MRRREFEGGGGEEALDVGVDPLERRIRDGEDTDARVGVEVAQTREQSVLQRFLSETPPTVDMGLRLYVRKERWRL